MAKRPVNAGDWGMFFLIALCHAIPVLIVGLGSNNRSRTIGTAVFMAAIGLLTGNPAYMVVDLLAVGLALGYCLSKGSGSSSDHRSDESYGLSPTESPKTHATSRINVAETSSGSQHMGLSSAIRLSSIYDERIRSYGFEPRALPPDLHATICSSFERRAEQTASESGMTDSRRLSFVKGEIEGAADLLVLCCCGPTEFGRKGGSFAVETIAEIVRTYVQYGPEGSLDLNLLNAVYQAGFVNQEFSRACEIEHDRQQQATGTPNATRGVATVSAVTRARERATRAALRMAAREAGIARDSN